MKKYYVLHEGASLDNGLIDPDVSYDGTWMTRGYKSHLGEGFVVEYNTDFFIYFKVI